MTRSYRDIELDIIRWGEERKIIPNATPQSQLNKSLEELAELFKAENQKRYAKIIDGVGDVLVTLILYCALKDIDMLVCLQAAYDEIKDRKGTLLRDGTFVKEQPREYTPADRVRVQMQSLLAGYKANGRMPATEQLVEAFEGAVVLLTQPTTA